jgi:hypothetical protein
MRERERGRKIARKMRERDKSAADFNTSTVKTLCKIIYIV